jgi:hypothetical protein
MNDVHKLAMLRVLRSAIGSRRWRIFRDAEGYPILRGRTGQIEPHCDGQDCHGCPMPGPVFAVWTDHRLKFAELTAIPGVWRWHTGDKEMRALVPPHVVDDVAAVIRVRSRRRISPEQLRRLREGLLAATLQPRKATEPAN